MSAARLVQNGPSIIVVCVVGLFALEALFPLRARTRPRPGRWHVNFWITALAFACGTFVVKASALRLSFMTERADFGLLHLAPLGGAGRLVLGFLLMDLTFYYWHRVNHTVPLLWRFHNVHHVDPDVDVSTSFRFHVVEVLYSTFFRAAQVLLIGVSPLTYAVYELVFTVETAFHHSNVRIPVPVERLLNKVIVTPRMHGIHHSTVRVEDNSNYSVIFRWWDLLHGSLRLNVPQSEVTIGVPGYLTPADNSVSALMTIPLAKQRDYWRYPDGSAPARADTFAYTTLMTE